MFDFFGLIGGAIIGAGALIGGAVLALPALGFTSAGVAAGSIAAFIQSYIGVVSSVVFAFLQSAGVLGLRKVILGGLGTIGALIGSGLGMLF